MEQRNVRLYKNHRLADGQIRLPVGTPGDRVGLRFGCAQAGATQGELAPAGEVHLAADLFRSLSVPYDGLGLSLRQTAPHQYELGPGAAVLYPGRESLSRQEAGERADLYYAHLQGKPGLLALGFDEEIDWERRAIFGYVLDNRPGREGRVVRTWFPIPAAVRLTWSIRRDVISRLRELTENRCFNWVRSIGKWEFHRLLSADEELRAALPQTRLLRGPSDLAAMLVRHADLFVKHDHGIKGRRSVRVRRVADGFASTYMEDGAQVERTHASLEELVPELRRVTGEGRCVVQQAIPIAGLDGRPLHIRIVTVRKPEGGWRPVIGTACIAGDDQAVFTNIANGAVEEPLLESLARYHGMSPDRALACSEQMEALCLKASAVLEAAYHPLGMLGFDLVVESQNHRIWFLEANAVPGWGYPQEVEEDLARSQIDLALSLTGISGAVSDPW